MLAKISRLIEERGLKQYEVERLCGLAENRISRWKNGQGEPTAQQILRIADLLNVPVRYLIDDAMDQPAPDVDDNQKLILKLAKRAGYDLAIDRLMGLPNSQPQGSTEKPATPRADVRVRDTEPAARVSPARDVRTGQPIKPTGDRRRKSS